MTTDITQDNSSLAFHSGYSDEAPNLEHLRVKRRNGDVVDYDDTKIKNAMLKTFRSIEGNNVADSTRITEIVNNINTNPFLSSFFICALLVASST